MNATALISVEHLRERQLAGAIALPPSTHPAYWRAFGT